MFSTHADTFLLGVKFHVKISGKFQHVPPNHLQGEENVKSVRFPTKEHSQNICHYFYSQSEVGNFREHLHLAWQEKKIQVE